jgi:hypothetical protein
VKRRLSTSAVVLAAALSLSACNAIPDNRSAASVGDATLSHSDLDELIIGAAPGTGTDERVTVPMSTAHNLLNTWLITSILSQDLERLGAEVSQQDLAEAQRSFEAQFGADWSEFVTPTLAELQITQQAVIEVWSGVDEEPPPPDEFRAIYEQGPRVSGITCAAHILVATEDEAEQVLAELDAGAEFGELAAERSIDPGSAANGGVLPCDTTASFAQNIVPEFVEAAFDATIGEPTGPVASQFGYHVILVRPFDDVADEGIADLYADTGTRFRRAARSADIHVDPRYGYFDPDAGVVSLG